VDIILLWIGALLTLYSIGNEHQIVHKFQERYGSLANFSDQQREAIYSLVCLRTVEMFLTEIIENPDYDWKIELPQKILLCFFNLHHHDEDRFDSRVYINKWTENIRQVYRTTGAIMAANGQEIYTKTRTELRFALDVQQVFAQQTLPTEQELNLPEYNDFIDDLHRRIYNEVMKPYESRAKTSLGNAWMFLYSQPSLEKIKVLQKQLIASFVIIYGQFREQPRDTNFSLQLSIINSILYSAVNKAGLEMPWHVSAPSLALEMHRLRPYLSCSLTPLVLQAGTDLVRIDCLDAKLKLCQQELETTRARLALQIEVNRELGPDVDMLREQVRALQQAQARYAAFFQQQAGAHADDVAPADDLRPGI